MEVSINIKTGSLFTHHGKQPFKMPKVCPICGGALKMKRFNDGTCKDDPYYFEFVCSVCETQIIAEGDEV